MSITDAAPSSPALEEQSPSRSRGPAFRWIAAALALVLLAGLGAWLLWPEDGEPSDTTAGTPAIEQTDDPQATQEPPEDPTEQASEEPTEEPTAEPTEESTEEPSEEPTAEPDPGTSSPAGTRGAMQAFVQNYFSQVTSDPASTFEMLTPQFKAQTGGFGRYSGFWNTISSATPYNIQADPQALTTSYTIDYVTTSGRTVTQQGQLQLEQRGEGYLIAGEG